MDSKGVFEKMNVTEALIVLLSYVMCTLICVTL